MRTLFRVLLRDFSIEEPEGTPRAYILKIDFGGSYKSFLVKFNRQDTMSSFETSFEYWTDYPHLLHKKAVVFQLFSLSRLWRRRKYGQICLSLYDLVTGPARLRLRIRDIEIHFSGVVEETCKGVSIILKDIQLYPTQVDSVVSYSLVSPPKRMDKTPKTLRSMTDWEPFVLPLTTSEVKAAYLLLRIQEKKQNQALLHVIGRVNLSVFHQYSLGLRQGKTTTPFNVHLTQLVPGQVGRVERLDARVEGKVEIKNGPHFLQMKGGYHWVTPDEIDIVGGEPWVGFPVPAENKHASLPYAPIPPLALRELFPESTSQAFLPVSGFDIEARLNNRSKLVDYWHRETHVLLSERNRDLKETTQLEEKATASRRKERAKSFSVLRQKPPRELEGQEHEAMICDWFQHRKEETMRKMEKDTDGIHERYREKSEELNRICRDQMIFFDLLARKTWTHLPLLPSAH